MKHIFLLLIVNSLFAMDDFLTHQEYEAELYKNPRGIGCYHCHGIDGSGKTISKYKHKGEDRVFKTKSIIGISFKKFSDGLNDRQKGMPRYHLTPNEIETLYRYLKD